MIIMLNIINNADLLFEGFIQLSISLKNCSLNIFILPIILLSSILYEIKN